MSDTTTAHHRVEGLGDDNPAASVREMLDILIEEDAPPTPYRTREYPSEILWEANQFAYSTGDDEARQARELAELAGHLLSIHDATTPVLDLLPLAAWAVLHGAPAELVTFAEDAS